MKMFRSKMASETDEKQEELHGIYNSKSFRSMIRSKANVYLATSKIFVHRKFEPSIRDKTWKFIITFL